MKILRTIFTFHPNLRSYATLTPFYPLFFITLFFFYHNYIWSLYTHSFSYIFYVLHLNYFIYHFIPNYSSIYYLNFLTLIRPYTIFLPHFNPYHSPSKKNLLKSINYTHPYHSQPIIDWH